MRLRTRRLVFFAETAGKLPKHKPLTCGFSLRSVRFSGDGAV